MVLSSLSSSTPSKSRIASNLDASSSDPDRSKSTLDRDDTQPQTRTSAEAMRELVNKRDDLNLKFLRMNQQVKDLRKKREDLIGPIQSESVAF